MRDAPTLILKHLRRRPVPLIPEIRLYLARDAAEVAWLPAEPPPYWAYVWPGGAALARHVLDHPGAVRGRRVLDLGAGSGLVGIAAALSGAAGLAAAEIDPVGRAALQLNCAANGIAPEIIADDLLAGAPPDADVVLVGDLLYERELAEAVVPFLIRCREAGIDVLIGDPGRGFLPRQRIRHLGDYGSGMTEDDRDSPTTPSSVFAFE